MYIVRMMSNISTRLVEHHDRNDRELTKIYEIKKSFVTVTNGLGQKKDQIDDQDSVPE